MERINIINSTKIFLNAFGLVLQDNNDVNQEIYDTNDNIVGDMNNCFNQNIYITTRVNGNILTANIKPHMRRLSRRYYRVLRSNFAKFEIKDSNSVSLMKGTMHITADCIQKSPISYGASFVSTYRDSKGRSINFSIGGGSILSVNITNGNTIEKFEIAGTKNVFRHILQKGEFDKKLNAFPYRKEVSITSDDEGTKIDLSEKVINKGKVKEIKKVKNQLPRLTPENGDFRGCYEKNILQVMELIHKYDSVVSKEIRTIRNDLSNYGELFVNLVSMCYDGYSDEVIDSIFDIERESFYQNGAKNLRDACLGIKSATQVVKAIGERE